jgi:hypothetical protein
MSNDEKHLKLLTTLHYIFGGLNGLFTLFPVAALIFGLWLLNNANNTVQGSHEAYIRTFPFIFLSFISILLGSFFTVCIFLSGRFLSLRKHYLFCFIMAWIECLFTPIGIALGVFTIIVLRRESVKQLFQKPLLL